MFVAAVLLAGVVYDFVTTIEAPRTSTRVAGRVWVEGNSYRAELAPDPKRGTDVVISTDADRTATFLDVDKQTWAYRVRVSNDVRSSSLFRWPLPEPHLDGKPVVTHEVGETTEIAGQRATLHIVTARFRVMSRVEGEKVGGTIETTARMWVADALPSLPMDSRVRTGWPEVDRELEPIFANISGMVMRHELEVTRTMDGGPPQREITKTIVSGVQIADVARERFSVPEGFEFKGAKAP